MIANMGANPMALEREQARIEGYRARNTVRVDRFLNARCRLIGVDKQALDAQVAEHAAQKQAERDAAAAELAQQQQIQALMEARDAEQREIRAAETERVRADREQQTLDRARRLAAERAAAQAPLLVDACGPSAVQTFRGEDAVRPQRVQAQKDQMRAWSQSQATEKRERAQAEAEQAARYHEYLMAITEARGQMEVRLCALCSETAC